MNACDLPPLLLPAPRQMLMGSGWWLWPSTLRVSGPVAALAVDLLGDLLPVVPTDDGELRSGFGGTASEAYRLVVTPSGIAITAADASGLRHAVATLRQLLRQYPVRLPCLTIDDAPAFAVRGVMLDISRDRVPTQVELYRMIDQLAGWKINHLQLYVEHTLAYPGHEAVWRGASPLTLDELRALDAHARSRGVTLAANQNCLGHLERWLKHPSYTPLAEIAPDQTWQFPNFATMTGPFSLCPGDARSLTLIEDLLGHLLPAVASPIANLGCDESYDLGQGRSADDVTRRGRAAVYLEWVGKVSAIARRHGKRPAIWADIALEHPEHLAQLPDDLIALCWGYEADAPFARWVAQVRGAGREAWVCPGTSCWNSFTGRTQERRANLQAAASQGIEAGATGWLATAWGDYGHRQPWPVTWRALAEAAHHAWSGAGEADPRAASLHAFDDDSLTVSSWLDRLGDADLPLRSTAGKDGTPLRNANALFRDTQKKLDETWAGDAAAWRSVLDAIGVIGPPTRLGDDQTDQELASVAALATWAAQRGFLRRSGLAVGTRAALVAGMRDIDSEHRRQWLRRSRPGGMEDSCAHWRRLAAELGG